MSVLNEMEFLVELMENIIKRRLVDHPHAPDLHRICITIGSDVDVSCSRDDTAPLAEFLQDYLIDTGVLKFIETAAEHIRSAVPAGGFPLSISFKPTVYLSGQGSHVRAENIALTSYGVNYSDITDWKISLKKILSDVEFLDDACPETFESKLFLMVRRSPSKLQEFATRVIFASSQEAAENKAILCVVPHLAKGIFDGSVRRTAGDDVDRVLTRLTVSPMSFPLSDRVLEPEIDMASPSA